MISADAVAVSGTTRYVLDASAKRVFALSAAGAVIASTGQLTTLGAPADIAVSSSKVYIADTGANQVVSIPISLASTTTTLEAGVSTGARGLPSGGSATAVGLNQPQGIAVDASDTLYIADTGNGLVEKVTGPAGSRALSVIAGGGSSTTLPAATPTGALLTTPRDVAVDATGTVYISEASGGGRIDKLDSSGTPLSSLSTAVTAPGSLAVASGTVVVTAATKAYALDAGSGGAATEIATGLVAAKGVDITSAGVVSVADKNGTSSRIWTVSPAANGQAPTIAGPSSLTVPTSKPFNLSLSATGSPTSWAITSPSPAPAWPVIDAASGTLSGTPSTAGTTTIVVRASNSSGYYEKTITLNVGAVPTKPAAAPKATPGQGSATVTWAAPTPSASPSPSASPGISDAITGYTVTPFVNGVAGTPVTASATATSTVVSGLSSGTAYTFKVAATNAFGTSELSDASTAVTPFGGFVQPAAGLTRYEGGTRVQTAVSVSRKLFPDTGSSRAVVIASSTNYADSLAGARLASAVGGPLLLTDPLALNTEVASEVARVLAVPAAAAAGSTPAASAGSAPSQTAVGTVYLLGGTSAVSAAVETAVKAVNAKYTVTRISGTDRFDTAVKIAAQTAADDGGASAPIYVASGTNYPDGLAVAALAARTGGVVLLTDGSTMPDATLKYLQTYDPNSELLVAVGGPAAKATSGHGASRAVIGTDRYDTARKVAELFTAPTGSAPVRSVGLATGDNWPDALAGAAAMGNLDGPLLLTPSGALSPSTSSALTALAKKGRPTSALVFGGSSVVSTGTANDFTSGATR